MSLSEWANEQVWMRNYKKERGEFVTGQINFDLFTIIFIFHRIFVKIVSSIAALAFIIQTDSYLILRTYSFTILY